ncbi:Uncharacterized protein APZ42_026263 [Daphnia magna]|uniref:Uncharacterized protein n=1 Tax=Daphnia magna TaxID=35525 RepID=A0A164SAW3_9CRUS|nr:Uncharacterized protein APZ42_026263 [Daphnia magna]
MVKRHRFRSTEKIRKKNSTMTHREKKKKKTLRNSVCVWRCLVSWKIRCLLLALALSL